MTTAPRPLFDPGLQPERTALAWRRTALSMGAGGVVALRIFPQLLGPWGYVPAAVALAIAVVIFVAAQVRYRRDRRILVGGALPAMVALATLALGLVALAVVLVRG
jgi:uncharacterized membrane protein YidH (DUF202 family)